MNPNQFVITSVTTGNIDLLVSLWAQSRTDKDGEITRQYINDRLSSIANFNKLVPFQTSCHQSKAEKFTSFPELVEAYDARRLKEILENDPDQLLEYLDDSRGAYIPTLVIRLLCDYEPSTGEEEVLGEVILQALWRLHEKPGALEEVWSIFLDKLEGSEEDNVIDFWHSLLRAINIKMIERAVGAKLEQWADFLAHLSAVEGDLGITKFRWSGDPIPIELTRLILSNFFDKYYQPTTDFNNRYHNVLGLFRGDVELLKYLLEQDFPGLPMGALASDFLQNFRSGNILSILSELHFHRRFLEAVLQKVDKSLGMKTLAKMPKKKEQLLELQKTIEEMLDQ